MSYRRLPVTKRTAKGKRKYRDLAVFNAECTKRSIRGNICELTNIRKLHDGAGLATVKSTRGAVGGREPGTWLLHFASHDIMKRHLKNRVIETAASLDGAGRRKKRKR
jgi:hypothetical protein